MTGSEFEELGAKARHSQLIIEQLRGSATGDGVSIEVDATNRLTAVELAPETMRMTPGKLAESILELYDAAIADVQPRLEGVLGEITNDQRVVRLEKWLDDVPAEKDSEPRATPREDGRSYIERRGGSIYQRWD